MNSPDSPWMPLREAASYAGRGRRLLAREIAAGRLKAARVGGRGDFVLRREWIDEWLESMARPLTVDHFSRRRANGATR